MEDKYVGLERELLRIMRRSRSLGSEAAAEVHPELDRAGYSTLDRIVETAPARAADLVEHFGIDAGAVSRQISQLERLGLVERTVDPDDARALAVRPTHHGEVQLRRVQQRRNKRFRTLVGEWPRKDVDELTRLLGLLNDAL